MIYILLALFFYTLAIIGGTIASRNAHPTLVTAITNAMSAVIPIAALIPLMNKKLFTDSKFGIIMAIVEGIIIALFTIFLNKSYATNKVAIVAPVVFGGAIFLSAILSYFFFKEKITFVQGIGLAFLAIGFVVIIYAKMSGR